MLCPREIRDMIYYEALSGGDFSTSAPPHGLVTVDQDAINAALLQVNRRVREEATEVMMKNQLFIRVLAYGVNLTHMMNLTELHIPIVAREIKQFGGVVNTIHRGFAMTHHIYFEDRSADQQCFIIPYRYFHIFCRALAQVDTAIRDFSQMTRHRVEIHDPFLGTEVPNALTIEKQVSR